MSQIITIEEASKCMKCGFCMSSCPVYAVDHIESHVARGRNVLIKRASAGDISSDGSYAERLSYCLLCGRCQSSCPAKVPSPDIAIAARTDLAAKRGLTWKERIVYRGILTNRALMARLLGLAAALPGISARNGKPLRHLPDLASLFSGGISIPRLSQPFLSSRISAPLNPTPEVKARGTLAIFPGCAFEYFFADAGEHMAKALAEANFRVVYPKNLTCCGIAVRNAGDLETARLMARQNIEILSSFDQIVSGCATCISALKDYAKWFPDDDPWQKRASGLASRVKDFSQFLVIENFKPSTAKSITVTYHDPCHSKFYQGISLEPRRLLHSIEGVEFIEMEGADDCCGLGGAFSINHREVSLDIQARKMQAIKRTAAQVVVTSCPGCMIQLMDGARRHRLPVEVMHISQMIRGQRVLPRRLR